MNKPDLSENGHPEPKEIVRGIYIPPRPKLLERIIDAMPSMEQVSEIIKTDPGVSGSIISVVNSPAYGLPNKVKSIQQAVSLLGLDESINIVNALLLRQATSHFTMGKIINFWGNCESVAQYMMKMSHHVDYIDPDEAYMLGLFYLCGIPILMNKTPKFYNLIRSGFAQGDTSPTLFEKKIYNLSHSHMSHTLGRVWKLDDDICEILRDLRLILVKKASSNTVRKKMALLLCCEAMSGAIEKMFDLQSNQYFANNRQAILEISELDPDLL